VKYPINLQYTIAEGGLAPYFEALTRSEALASECKSCQRVAFPARMVCGACGSHQVQWTALSGLANLIYRTDGTELSFALVKFAGADTLSTVGLLNPGSQTTSGRLRSLANGQSGIWIELNETTDGDNHV